MASIRAVAMDCDMVTAYGWGTDICWNGLLSGRTAIAPLSRFETNAFQAKNAALIPGLDTSSDESLVMQMLRPLLTRTPDLIPRDAGVIVATTNGEINILERAVLDGNPDEAGPSRLNDMVNKVSKLAGAEGPGMLVSSACISSAAAAAQAAAMISDGELDCVLVAACDCVSEFIFSGFSSLMALDKDMARPFDKNRRGLSIGEAAGFILLMSESRALKEGRPIIGEIAGWGLSLDANHMTGPSRDGSGLALAIRKSLKISGGSAEDAGCICAHGTGTVYNDAMEIKAFRTVFGENPVPTYSIKGGTGHTMGAAGLLEIILGFRSLKEKIVPPTVNLRNPDADAEGWVSPEPRNFDSNIMVSTNSGFGGVNCSLVLKI